MADTCVVKITFDDGWGHFRFLRSWLPKANDLCVSMPFTGFLPQHPYNGNAAAHLGKVHDLKKTEKAPEDEIAEYYVELRDIETE